ncbi:MAG: glycosyltransferase [Spirochaetaceae bacterium]|nr:glycosyltransferase [Spirochaetaceae bacterium]
MTQHLGENNMPPKVSVIIPVYNTFPFLRECMDGIVNQTLQDIEIILINDGSTDGSLAILEEYKQNDSRIIIINQENKGAGAARNAGLDIVQGEYLSILDSDDIYDVTMLEKMYTKAEELQVDFVVCFCKFFDNATKNEWPWEWSGMSIEKKVFSFKDTLNISQNFDFFTGSCYDKLYKRSFIDKHKLRFQEISHSNDGFFVFYTMYAAERIAILKEFFIKYRINRVGNLGSTHHQDTHSFYEMHKAVRYSLVELGVLEVIKERFAVWSFKHCWWVLNEIKTWQAFLEVYSIIQNKLIPENKTISVPIDMFDVKFLYDEAREINELSAAEYLFVRRKSLRVEYTNLQEEHNNLQAEHINLSVTYRNLQMEYNNLSAESNHLQNEYSNLQNKYTKLLGKMRALVNSRSYRVGRMFTYIPRKIRWLIHNLKKYGLTFTVKLVGKKIIRKIKKSS